MPTGPVRGQSLSAADWKRKGRALPHLQPEPESVWILFYPGCFSTLRLDFSLSVCCFPAAGWSSVNKVPPITQPGSLFLITATGGRAREGSVDRRPGVAVTEAGVCTVALLRFCLTSLVVTRVHGRPKHLICGVRLSCRRCVCLSAFLFVCLLSACLPTSTA